MTSEFLVYLELGFEHIADLGAYDHILFVVALSAGYALTHWRQLLILVTAFTVGHSVTLALATLRIITISSYLVEVLIPVTIIVTGLFNVVESRLFGAERPDVDGGGRGGGWVPSAGDEEAPSAPPSRARHIKYGLALFFGLIHGLGFSTFLRAVLGEEEGITLPLFSFNVGLEFGQIGILSVVLVLTFAMVQGLGVKAGNWALVLSGTTTVAALVMLVGRLAETG
jgi:hypothetical protein